MQGDISGFLLNNRLKVVSLCSWMNIPVHSYFLSLGHTHTQTHTKKWPFWISLQWNIAAWNIFSLGHTSCKMKYLSLTCADVENILANKSPRISEYFLPRLLTYLNLTNCWPVFSSGPFCPFSYTVVLLLNSMIPMQHAVKKQQKVLGCYSGRYEILKWVFWEKKRKLTHRNVFIWGCDRISFQCANTLN